MRLAADDVRCTHQNAHTGAVRGLGGIEARREFGKANTIADRLLDMFEGRVVVAAET